MASCLSFSRGVCLSNFSVALFYRNFFALPFEVSMPRFCMFSSSSSRHCGSTTTPLPITQVVPLYKMPDGRRRSLYSSPDKILAFAGMSPTTYQSGKYTSPNATMEKRGSRYLRCALFLTAHLVGRYSKTFATYLKKKRDEDKHYFVALSLVAKKLLRVIFHLQRTGESFLDFP